jgi:mitochondrial fission protein ELM1
LALSVRKGAQIREIDLAGKSFFGKLRVIWGQGSGVRVQDSGVGVQGSPDFIIAAGHGTHLPLLLCGWLYKKARTVVCMKPSFPMQWFDFCIVPRHDLTPAVLANPPAHIIPTLGALHGVHPSPERPKSYILILIGGPSKEYGWDEKQVIEQLKAVSSWQLAVGSQQSGAKFLLTTSRRTPAGFVDTLRKECSSIEIVPVEETPRGWVADKLAGVTAVWVTRDSVSMIYEALGSGAPVGLLNMSTLLPDGKKKSRVAKGIAMLEDDGWVTPFDTWKETGILKSKGALVEVDRVADILLSQ